MRSAPSRSALLMTNRSAISRIPALIAWMSSPSPGTVTTTTVSTVRTTSTSSWPTPTVSTSTQSNPAASSRSTASRVARARPPSAPRVAIERMNTPGSVAIPCMRMRSPSRAPPENGLDGSTQRMPTVSPAPAAGLREAVDQRALAGPRRTGDADDAGPPAAAVEPAHQLGLGVAAVLEQRHAARHGPRLARQDPLDQRRQVDRPAAREARAVAHQPFASSCRAMTRRWISLVPSPMVQIFASR